MKKQVWLYFFCMIFLLISCGKSNKCIGVWEGDINRSQSVKLTVEKDGRYHLSIYQNRERFDLQYSGDWQKLSNTLIALPSDAYLMSANSRRRDSDPSTTIVNTKTVFYLQSDGALSRSEDGLIYEGDKPIAIENPTVYLYKTSEK